MKLVCSRCGADWKNDDGCSAACEPASVMAARIAALEKDAARYRWLKINARRIDFAGLSVSDGAQLDARIDAAMSMRYNMDNKPMSIGGTP